MKIRPVGSKMSHANKHDKANSRFSQFYERAENIGKGNPCLWFVIR